VTKGIDSERREYDAIVSLQHEVEHLEALSRAAWGKEHPIRLRLAAAAFRLDHELADPEDLRSAIAAFRAMPEEQQKQALNGWPLAHDMPVKVGRDQPFARYLELEARPNGIKAWDISPWPDRSGACVIILIREGTPSKAKELRWIRKIPGVAAAISSVVEGA
jgi:hypothetical protein